jgi:predicted aminopeptidase
MRWPLLLAAVALLSGCAQIGYLGQAASGHLRLVGAAKPVEELVQDPALDADLRARLHLSQRLRDFAARELGLPDNASYRRYADLQRGAAVWNVVAAPELGLRLKTWCYPVMGCAGYRGFFDKAAAEAYAAALREAEPGLEVLVYGVPAYSTLGWAWLFGGDPLLNTFIRYPEGELARMIFHELAHQVAYAADDTEFNESFATAVERLGVEAWLAAQGDAAARAQYRRGDERRERFRTTALAYRARLKALYESPLDTAAKRAAKAALFAELRVDPALDGHAQWRANANNASLAIQAAYNALTPEFEALFERRGRDWAVFYAEVRRLAALPREQRRRELRGG